MNKRSKLALLGLLIALFASLSACQNETKSEETEKPPVNELTLYPAKELTIEEAKAKVPFAIKEPTVPFTVTETSAYVLETNQDFEGVEITYKNADEGYVLTIMINNAQRDRPPNGTPGPKLANGSETWDQSNPMLSAVFWSHDNLNYTLVSMKMASGKSEPLYSFAELLKIADSIP